MALVLVLMFRGDHSRVVRRMALAFAAIVLLSPHHSALVHSLVRPLPGRDGGDQGRLADAVPLRRRDILCGVRRAGPVVSLVLRGGLRGPVLAGIRIALLFAFYLVFLDIHTRRLLVQGKLSRWVGGRLTVACSTALRLSAKALSGPPERHPGSRGVPIQWSSAPTTRAVPPARHSGW